MMLEGQPHVRFDNGQTSFGNQANTSESNSAESLGRETPSTPPHVSLDPVIISGASEFSNFFRWIQQAEGRARSSSVLSSSNAGTTGINAGTSPADHEDYLAAFQRKATIRLPRSSVQASTGQVFEPPATSSDLTPASALSHSIPDGGTASLGAPQGSSSSAGHADAPAGGRVSFCDADYYPADHPPRRSFEMRDETTGLSSSPQPPSELISSPVHPATDLSDCVPTHASLEAHGSPRRPLSTLSHSSPAPAEFDPNTNASTTSQPAPPLVPRLMELADEEWNGYGELLDLYEDDRLPGYQVWKRGSSSSSAMAVRIPRQMVGWKAVLMDAIGFDAAAFNAAESVKQARRASKVLGKQGWEVRQEGMKNSYDFRRGSGILATMHAGHRLFKHDWHIMVKDGSRYVWRMNKQALALYREDSDVKVAEFRKALPRSSTRSDPVGSGMGYMPDADKRIGTFKYEAATVPAGIFDINLALISLMAVFGARGGHQKVSAAFEPSSDPLRRVLEQQRQETRDREEVMLAMPRPGFARDTESVLSDTTDEDGGEEEVESELVARCVTSRMQVQSGPPAPYPAPDMLPPGSQVGHDDYARPRNTANRQDAGRKRFSSFFGRGTTPADGQFDRGPKTDSEKIVRQYRTQSMFFGRSRR
ncbi:uncharacterized protein UBRO_01879 [Ustilago bromivora]|uniref:Uncharacterized protein n=2 Tax=Ustilago bromivora TaxID=307758 RepID=A0A1K0FZX0_9BASI|nr:uncharacterized protein UBRO_01879 [Ustilago bromivora]